MADKPKITDLPPSKPDPRFIEHCAEFGHTPHPQLRFRIDPQGILVRGCERCGLTYFEVPPPLEQRIAKACDKVLDDLETKL